MTPLTEEERKARGCTHPADEPCFTPPPAVPDVDTDACGHGDDPDENCEGCYG